MKVFKIYIKWFVFVSVIVYFWIFVLATFIVGTTTILAIFNLKKDLNEVKNYGFAHVKWKRNLNL